MTNATGLDWNEGLLIGSLGAELRVKWLAASTWQQSSHNRLRTAANIIHRFLHWSTRQHVTLSHHLNADEHDHLTPTGWPGAMWLPLLSTIARAWSFPASCRLRDRLTEKIYCRHSSNDRSHDRKPITRAIDNEIANPISATDRQYTNVQHGCVVALQRPPMTSVLFGVEAAAVGLSSSSSSRSRRRRLQCWMVSCDGISN